MNELATLFGGPQKHAKFNSLFISMFRAQIALTLSQYRIFICLHVVGWILCDSYMYWWVGNVCCSKKGGGM